MKYWQVSFQDPAHCGEALCRRVIDTGEESPHGCEDSVEGICRDLKFVRRIGLDNDTASKFRSNPCKAIAKPT
jgi:hypothetical protein